MLLQYNWLHIPTGKTGQRRAKFISWLDLYQKLNRWQKPGLWQYWAS
jgi:hypothetical protein